MYACVSSALMVYQIDPIFSIYAAEIHGHHTYPFLHRTLDAVEIVMAMESAFNFVRIYPCAHVFTV